MNLSGQLDVVDLTTLARVRTLIPQAVTDTTMDATITQFIADVSARIGRYIGWHLLSQARVETYEIRKFQSVLRLDAKPVTAPTAVKVSGTNLSGADWTAAGAASASTYSVNLGGGWLRFYKSQISDPGYVQVSYTGGFGAAASNVISDFPELAQACEIQVKYLLERLASIGGDVTTTSGAGTSFNSAYALHREVVSILALHRRAAI